MTTVAYTCSCLIICSCYICCKSIARFTILLFTFEPPFDKTNKMTALSKDSVQPGHPPNLIRVFAVRMKKHSAQADLSLRWAHIPFCWFCHEAAHLSFIFFVEITISDPSFIGEKSYMSFAPVYIKHKTDIKLQIKTNVSDGLVFYVARQLHSYSGDFLSLVLHAGKMEMRYHHGDKLNVLTSDYRLKMDSGTIIVSHVTRKPVFGVSDQVRLKPADETS